MFTDLENFRTFCYLVIPNYSREILLPYLPIQTAYVNIEQRSNQYNFQRSKFILQRFPPRLKFHFEDIWCLSKHSNFKIVWKRMLSSREKGGAKFKIRAKIVLPTGLFGQQVLDCANFLSRKLINKFLFDRGWKDLTSLLWFFLWNFKEK